MADNANRCTKHGTFTGNLGCPFCKEQTMTNDQGISDPQTRAAQGVEIVGVKVSGVKILSQREGNAGTSESQGVQVIADRDPGDESGN